MVLRLTILFLILSNCCFAQNGHLIPFKNDSNIVDKNGVPKDSTTFYFPANEYRDTLHSAVRHDSTSEWNSINKYESRIAEDCQIKTLSDYAKKKKIPIAKLKDTIYTAIDLLELECFSS